VVEEEFRGRTSPSNSSDPVSLPYSRVLIKSGAYENRFLRQGPQHVRGAT